MRTLSAKIWELDPLVKLKVCNDALTWGSMGWQSDFYGSQPQRKKKCRLIFAVEVKLLYRQILRMHSQKASKNQGLSKYSGHQAWLCSENLADLAS